MICSTPILHRVYIWLQNNNDCDDDDDSDGDDDKKKIYTSL
jgi:hypothetical protein